jgi:hypothetical protein
MFGDEFFDDRSTIKWTQSLAIGTEIKISEKMVLDISPEIRHYPKVYYKPIYAIGLQAGIYYRY